MILSGNVLHNFHLFRWLVFQLLDGEWNRVWGRTRVFRKTRVFSANPGFGGRNSVLPTNPGNFKGLEGQGICHFIVTCVVLILQGAQMPATAVRHRLSCIFHSEIRYLFEWHVRSILAIPCWRELYFKKPSASWIVGGIKYSTFAILVLQIRHCHPLHHCPLASSTVSTAKTPLREHSFTWRDLGLQDEWKTLGAFRHHERSWW